MEGKDYFSSLENIKVPVLVLDQKWHRLFALNGKPKEVLLLEKEESLKKLFSHRILRFFLSLSLFVFVTMIFDLVKYGTRPTVLGFFKDVYQGGNLTQQWFLFSYLSLLFILPFLRK